MPTTPTSTKALPSGAPPAPGAGAPPPPAGAPPAPPADDLAPPPDDTGADADAAPGGDPYSAQVLKRMHEDFSTLMADYHEMLGQLEHPEIKAHLEGKLADLEQALTEVEQLYGSHHSNLPPIPGALGADDGMGGDAPPGGELPPETPAAPEGGDAPPPEVGSAGVSDNEATPAASGNGPPEEVSEEDAVEGMKKGKGKALPAKATKGGDCAGCGKMMGDCKCNTKAAPLAAAAAGGGSGAAAGGAARGAGSAVDAGMVADVVSSQQENSMGLDDHERGYLTKIKDHLLGIATRSSLGDPDRLGSWHHGELAEEIAGRGKPKSKVFHKSDPDGEDKEKEGKKEDEDDKKGGGPPEGLKAPPPDAPAGGEGPTHEHRVFCAKVAKFLKDLVYSTDFGDKHKQQAVELAKALDELLSIKENPAKELPVEGGDKEEGGEEPKEKKESDEKEPKDKDSGKKEKKDDEDKDVVGETDTKALRERLLRQQEEYAKLAATMTQLTGVLNGRA